MFRRAPITMGLATASFGLLVGVGLALWLPDAGMSHGTADSELGAALLGGSIVALVVFLNGRQSQWEEDQQALAQSLVARFTSPAFMKNLAATAVFLRGDEHEGEEVSRWAAWERLPVSKQQQILGSLNTFELIGAAYVAKEANRTILRSNFEALAPALWDQADWLVHRLRYVARNPRLFEQWERMVADFRRVAARRRPLETYEPSTEATDSVS